MEAVAEQARRLGAPVRCHCGARPDRASCSRPSARAATSQLRRLVWKSRLLLTGIGGGAALLFAAVGLLVARVEPRNAIGWIFLGSAAFLASIVTAYSYVDFALPRRGVAAGGRWIAWLGGWSFIPAGYVAPVFVAQLFPDGRPLPGRWRWLLWIIGRHRDRGHARGELARRDRLVPGEREPARRSRRQARRPHRHARRPAARSRRRRSSLAALAALVVRFRRSRGIERQQMKWLAFAGAVPVDRVLALVRLGPGRRRRARAHRRSSSPASRR